MQESSKQCAGACPKPAVSGHILCDGCRIEQGGINFHHTPYVGGQWRNKEYPDAPHASVARTG